MKNIEFILVENYSNETDYSLICTIKDKDGRFPLCITGTVYYGLTREPISRLLTGLGKPYFAGKHDLVVFKINSKFAVYDENHKKITQEYDFMDDLIDEIDERDLRLFDFEYDKKNI